MKAKRPARVAVVVAVGLLAALGSCAVLAGDEPVPEASPASSPAQVAAMEDQVVRAAGLAEEGRPAEARRVLEALDGRLAGLPGGDARAEARLEGLRGAVSVLLVFLTDSSRAGLSQAAASPDVSPDVARSLRALAAGAGGGRRTTTTVGFPVAEWQVQVAALVQRIEAVYARVVQELPLGEVVVIYGDAFDLGVSMRGPGDELIGLADELAALAPPFADRAHWQLHDAVHDAADDLAHAIPTTVAAGGLRSHFDEVPLGETKQWRRIVAKHDAMVVAAAAVAAAGTGA
ncbi:MAG TPA: hypothetical protein VFO65_14735 [Acidimicrobiales bacterium]|nr:hypothetical protein [Acidimicrobiales bacterium]